MNRGFEKLNISFLIVLFIYISFPTSYFIVINIGKLTNKIPYKLEQQV